ncbi:hypothetical protein H0N98_00875 [Candidatus Micrarchaeota archaeon]|nr:hypothetical protein [Candidatus Micrarchaeota archaeon]
MKKFAKEEDKPAMPPILKEDLLARTLAPREGEGKVFRDFKKEIKTNLGLNAGCIAIAKKMCDDPEFYKFLEEAMNEREKSGYKSRPNTVIYSFLKSDAFNFQAALSEISKGKSMSYLNLPGTKLYGRVGYDDLKRSAESDPSVIMESSALDTLYEKYRDEFKRRLASFTLHDGMFNNMAATFMIGLLRTVQEKHLYEGEFKFADIGTGSGEFSDEFLSFIKERFSKYKVVRTNPVELQIHHHEDMKVRIHDIDQESLGEKFNVVIIKDVMKFFKDGKPRGVIWENVKQSTEEGGVVLSGGHGIFKVHVMYKGELLRVSPDAFLEKAKRVEDYNEYMEKLGDIVRRSDYHLIVGHYTG